MRSKGDSDGDTTDHMVFLQVGRYNFMLTYMFPVFNMMYICTSTQSL